MPETGINNQIRRLRFEHNEMTQQQLADKVSLTRQTIAAIEANKYSPSLKAAFQISSVFGLTLIEVFGWQTNTGEAE